MINTFATAEQIQSYNLAIGAPNATTTNELATPPAVYTTEEVEQANRRSNNHIRIKFYGNFKPEFQADDLAGLPEQVRADLQEAVSIGAGQELLTPNIFKSVYTPPTGSQQVKKTPSGREFFEQKAGTTVVQVSNNRGQDADIHDLLDKYLLVPQHTQNQGDVCPPANQSTGLGLFVGR